jgi:hypothetical protein
MISLYKIASSLLTEKMSFKDLLNYVNQARKDKAKKMSVSSLTGTATSTSENWNFSYKSDMSHSTTGKRFQGRITYENSDVAKSSNASADDIFCSVDCQCPDYKYRWAYANNNKDAGPMGNDSLNQCNGNRPIQTNPYLTPGLCKHLVSLHDYLKTKLEESNQPTFAEKMNEIVKNNPRFVVDVQEYTE